MISVTTKDELRSLIQTELYFFSDLSKWDVSKIIGINEMFTMAKKMTEELKPKFNNLRYVSLN